MSTNKARPEFPASQDRGLIISIEEKKGNVAEHSAALSNAMCSRVPAVGDQTKDVKCMFFFKQIKLRVFISITNHKNHVIDIKTNTFLHFKLFQL